MPVRGIDLIVSGARAPREHGATRQKQLLTEGHGVLDSATIIKSPAPTSCSKDDRVARREPGPEIGGHHTYFILCTGTELGL
jgi:hypothetical protein